MLGPCEGAHDPRNDAALVRVCNEGDETARRQAFSVLFQRHRAGVLRIARRYAADDATAEDAVHDTFEYLLHRFPPEGKGVRLTARLTTLLYVVAEHAALAAARRASRCAGCDVDPDDLPAAQPPESDFFEAMLDALPPAQRETMRLRFGEDCPYCEIADRTGVPVGTVKSRVHQARDKLRRLAAAHQFD